MELNLRDKVKLYYEEYNAGAEKAIVFLNGLTQSTASWLGVYPLLASEFNIILVDSVCQGKSGKAEKFRNYDEHAKDISELLNHLKKKKVILVGISYGGAVAQHVLVNHSEQVSGAVLISTFAHKTPHFNAIGESWVTALEAGGYPLMFNVMLPFVLGEDYFENPIIPLEELKKLRLQNNLQKEDLLKLIQATEKREDYRQELNKINKPVLVIHGEKDLLIPVNVGTEIQKNIKNSRLEVIEKAGHTLNLESIPKLAQLIKEFSEAI